MKTITDRFSTYMTISFVRLTILFASIIILSSCCQHADRYSVTDDFKQYIYFPEGSYWVYKNQFNNYDTLTITNIVSKYEKYNAESCDEFEKITIDYNSSSKGEITRYTSHTNAFFTLCEYNTANSYFNELTDFGKNLKNENKVLGCLTAIEWLIQDTVEVNHKYFFNVYVNKTISDIPTTIVDYPFLCYFSKNIGLIKKELQNGEVWELVDYKINK